MVVFYKYIYTHISLYMFLGLSIAVQFIWTGWGGDIHTCPPCS